MSREITEENAQGVFALHSHNENLKAIESSMNDMKIASIDNPTVGEMLHSREIIRSDNCMNGVEDVLSKDAMRNENSSEGTNGGCTNENFIERVSHLDILQNKTENVESSIDQGTSTQGQMSQPLGNFEKYSDLSDSSDNEDYANIELKGLVLQDKEFDDEESVESGDIISESEIEDYESEGEEIQMKEAVNVDKKKRKVQQEDWLSVIGVDKVCTDLPLLSALELNNKEEFTHMGNLECVIDRIVTIAGLPGMPAYDFDTLLFLEEGRKVLGYVLDIMGPVTAPLYIVPMNSVEASKEQLQKGTKVYCAPKSKYTNYVFLQELMKNRGSSSSWPEDTDVPSEFQELSEDERERSIKASRKETKRKCSQERYRKFVKDMNRANERNTRLHRMADVHRLHLERVARGNSVNRPQTRDSRTQNQNSGRKSQNLEGRRSRPLFRNNPEGPTLNDLQNWSLMTNPLVTNASNFNAVPVLPPFDPSVPPPNYAGSSFYLPSEGSTFSSFVGLVHPPTFSSRGVEFERSINRPNFRQSNMPGPSNESWFN